MVVIGGTVGMVGMSLRILISMSMSWYVFMSGYDHEKVGMGVYDFERVGMSQYECVRVSKSGHVWESWYKCERVGIWEGMVGMSRGVWAWVGMNQDYWVWVWIWVG